MIGHRNGVLSAHDKGVRIVLAVTVHGLSVILSVAKDLGRIALLREILRYAQDDGYLTGP